MACNVPAVITDFGDNADWVERGRGGLLFPLRDHAALADGIVHLLKNPVAAAQIGRRGGEIINELNNMHRQMRKIDQLYRELASSQNINDNIQMKSLLRELIKKIPHAIDVYAYWHRFKAEYFGVGLRDWTKTDIEEIRAHWEDRFLERNYFVRDKIARFSPESILEIGCGSGVILFLLAQQFPAARLIGVEINPSSVVWGNDRMRLDGVNNVVLQEGRAEQLDVFPDKSFDVVFSSAAIMYVKPERIIAVLRNMTRIARKAVILVEMHDDNLKRYLGEFHLPNNWKRNYRRIFEEIGVSSDRIRIEPIPAHIWSPGGGGAAYIEVIVKGNSDRT
jgi:SAM-dependent methyltransferase